MFRPSRIYRTNRRRQQRSSSLRAAYDWLCDQIVQAWQARVRTRMLRRVTWAMNLRLASRTISQCLFVTWCLFTAIGFGWAWIAQSPSGARIVDLADRQDDLTRQRQRVRQLSAQLEALNAPEYRRQLRRQRLKMVCPNERVWRSK
ncbi:MAG TPA: hypothetical protein DCQ06_14600 [Myxococcales bacterium]|nr:hypothetical protein [Myxococcales bacterium]